MDQYFFIGDVIGFGNIVSNSKSDALDERIKDWLTLIDEAQSASGITQVQLISDTVFATSDASADGLGKVLRFGRQLLSGGCNRSLPIRGSITFGSVTWTDRLTYGRAVIDAHILETRQEWIGVACSGSLPNVDEYWGYDHLVCYPVPMKDGLIQLLPALNWEVPEFDDLVKLLTAGGLTKGKDEMLTWPWARKVKNTIEFRLYTDFVRRNNLDVSKFYGTLPIQIFRS